MLDREVVDGAILDVKLADERVFPVAAMLRARGVPFLFAIGYGGADLPPEWRQIPRIEKPVDAPSVVRALLGLERH